jgi:hypothetical protein
MSATIPSRSPDIHAWLRYHGLDPALVYRVEVVIPVDDVGTMTVYEYKVNADGDRYLDQETQQPATRAHSVSLKALPPTSIVRIPGSERDPDPPVHLADASSFGSSNREYLRKM